MTPKEKKPACAFSGCATKPIKENKCCKKHADFFEKIRQDLEENPMLLYNQRSDNPNRMLIDKDTGKRKKSKGKNLPVCCVPGCFELRIPPDAYCFSHGDFAGGD